MYNNADRLLKLQELVYTTLDPLIDKDYCLLDMPEYSNIGDQLICEGQLAYLKRLKHKLLYTCNDKYEDFSKIPANSIILLQGGGNFGDLWKTHQEFRLKVIQQFPLNKIIVFPQTVFYRKNERLLEDAQIFNQHNNLTICARDQTSFELLKKHFTNNNILLLPDMAFCLNLNKYIEDIKTNKVLIFKRTDKEANKKLDENNLKSLVKGNRKIEIKDWPSFDNKEIKFKIVSLIIFLNRNISKKMAKSSFFRPLLNSRYGLIRGNLGKWYMNEGIKFINKYEEIYSMRLHGYILSILLNKKVYMVDNSYGKNSTFYNTWMLDFENSYLL